MSRRSNVISVCGFFCIFVLSGLLAFGMASPAPAALAMPGDPNLANQPIIIDHTTVDISKIPLAWIAQAKTLALHFGHTSHGSQILTGLDWLMNQNAQYTVDIRYTVEPSGGANGVQIYDGNNYNGDNYITPEMYWSTIDGLSHTRSVAESGAFQYSMWAWCGQQSGNDDATVDQYLGALNQLETEYPEMRFIYFTGHTDGGSELLAHNNDRLRTYVRANGKILFDFADIESYDPAGNYYANTDDSCPWCAQWCQDHPSDCSGLPLDQPDWCAHSHPLNCKLKAQAFWWMMARLAGWDGRSGSSTPIVTPKPTTTPFTPSHFAYVPAVMVQSLER
jgi:hypothetical protein